MVVKKLLNVLKRGGREEAVNRPFMTHIIYSKLFESSYMVKMGMGDEKSIRNGNLVEQGLLTEVGGGINENMGTTDTDIRSTPKPFVFKVYRLAC